ncbi:PucR family transcriptional regulator [Gordonia hydrophobica]|uniref:Helix-turn-helix domain-containing protein n=1 Tax=Gordonia hydrophobica TaxID=40516 RepID=A0ABZ2TY16_9ACTN|nr:helix-turn-helix domain-containing protein [Gordonia hydrophobica]MBM7366551.1 DNA-binding PucR family transcriptional regulator [Gordonia hydrophobica]
MSGDYAPGMLGSPDPERLSALTAQIGARLKTDTAAISEGMTAAIEQNMAELDIADMHASLHASVVDNVEVIVDLLAERKDATDLPALPDAHRYAVDLAQQRVPEASLRRAYHVGSNHLLAHIFDQVRRLDCEPQEKLQLYHHLAGWTYQYVDEITRSVIATYQEEQRSSRERAARATEAIVTQVLAGDDVPALQFRAATGYELQQPHLACCVWIDTADPAHPPVALSGVIERLRAALAVPGEALVVSTGRHAADVWFGWSTRRTVDVQAVRPLVDAEGSARIAFGTPDPGADGFRTSLARAHQVATIARVGGTDASRVVSYADDGVPVIARLADDLVDTRHWVRQTLRDLALETDDAARQRETVRVFLKSGSNFSRTASELMLHRNTIRYRLTAAEKQLGRHLTDKPLDTQLALEACRMLGSAVLTAEEPRTAWSPLN